MTPYSTISGTAYGVALNDRDQLAALDGALHAPPHGSPPKAPVLYIKPRNCFSFGGAPAPPEVKAVRIAATVAVQFQRELMKARPEEVRPAIGAACLALDLCEAGADYFRPPIPQLCRDGFLPLGGFAALPAKFGEIVTEIDGKPAHRWSLERLHRPLETLAADISAFMTLRAGDILLIGLAGDAPEAAPGASIAVHSQGLPSLTTSIVRSQV